MTNFLIFVTILISLFISVFPYQSLENVGDLPHTFFNVNITAAISFSSAGDFNNDGLVDILIGAKDASPNGNSQAGETYLIFGTNPPLSLQFNISSLNGTNGIIFNGIDTDDISGYSVSSAGDFNNDGFDDILIGAYGADPNGNSGAGETYLIFGTNQSFSSQFNLSSINGTNGIIFNGIDGGDESGTSVSSAGDFNNDGFADILIGAHLASPNGNSAAGETYLIFGTNQSLSSQFNLSSLNGTNGIIFNGIDGGDSSGFSVSSAGDFNNDGFDDILIGAYFAAPNGNVIAGETYMIFGTNQYFASQFNLSSINGTNGIIFNGIDASDNSGWSVSSAGDFNNDGFDDILIGANQADPNFSESGETYLVFGTSSFLGASVDLALLDGTNGIIFNGIDTNDNSGRSVSSAGDFNNDGFDDILIGAHQGDPNGISNAGETYVVFGTNKTISSPFDLSSKNINSLITIMGESVNNEVGRMVSLAGDFNNDGLSDIIISSKVSGKSNAYVVYGLINCLDGFTGTNCVACPKPPVSYQYNSSFCDLTPFSCPVDNFQFYSPETNGFTCISCPSDSTIGNYFTDGQTTRCEFELTGKCNSGEYLEITPGTNFDSYNCRSCQASAMNSLPNTKTSCSCVEGSIYNGDSCVLATESFNSSIVGLSLFSLSFCGFAGVFYFFKFHKASDSSESNQSFVASFIPFDQWKPVLNPSVTDIFQTLSLFIWTPQMIEFENSQYLSKSQVFTSLSYLKLTPFIPGSVTHLDLGSKLKLGIPFMTFLQVCGMLFLIQIPWTLSLVYGKSVLPLFLFNFGAENYIASVAFSICVGFFVLLSSQKPQLFGTIVHFLTIPLLFSYLSVFNCVSVPDGIYDVDSSQEYVFFSLGENSLQCWSNEHIILFCLSIVMLILFTTLIIYHKTEITTQHWFKFFVVVSFLFFSTPSIVAPYLQLIILLSFAISSIVYALKYIDKSYERYFQLFSQILFCFLLLIGFIALFVNNSNNLASGTLLLLTSILFVLFGLPLIEQLWYQQLFSKFFNLKEAPPTTSESPSNQLPVASTVSILLLIGICISIPLDKLGSDGILFNGIDFNDRSGWSVSSAGDFNNDGFADILIGAYNGDPNGNSAAGETYLIFGSNQTLSNQFNLSSINGTNGVTFNGIDPNDYSGDSVSYAGDFNNDGFDDILIGAFRVDANGKSDAGATYLLFGTNQPFSSQFNLSSINGTNGIIFNGIDVNDFSGSSISSAGDFNNDGFDDILIGGYWADPNGNSNAGETYLIFGTNQSFGSQFNLSSINGTNGIQFNGIDVGDNSGYSVSSAGDFNNDGFDDILIGADRANSESGEIYLIFGTNQPSGSQFNLSSLNGTNGIIFNGIDVNDRSGYSVASAGDFNNDGFDDILIGAPYSTPNGNSFGGEAYLIFGTNQSIGSQFNLSSINGTNGIIFEGIDAFEYSGKSVSSAGDFNNDGFDDILIGAWAADSSVMTDFGEIYVIFGTNLPFDSPFNVSFLNSSTSLLLSGFDPLSYCGGSVSFVGDFSSDGIDDILIGCYRLTPFGNSNAGGSVLVKGSSINFCSPGYRFDMTSKSCILCTSSKIGPQNINESRTLSCSVSVDWDSYLNCTENQVINITNNPVGSCIDCVPFPGVTYLSTKFECNPQCDAFHRLENSFGNLSCVPCPEGQNPEVNNYPECACRGEGLNENNKCLPFPRLTGTVDGGTLGYFSGIGGILLFLGFFVYRKQTSQTKILNKNLHIDSLQVFIDSRNDYSTEDFESLFRYLFDYVFCSLSLLPRVNSVNNGDNSVNTDDNSVNNDDNSVEMPEIKGKSENVDTSESHQEISKIRNYFLQFPILAGTKPFYSTQDKILLAKIFIEFAQFIGLLGGLNLIQANFGGSSFVLFIFSIFNFNFGFLNFIVIFWIVNFFVLIWALILIANWKPSLPLANLLYSISHRLIPLLGGIFVIPIVSTLFKAFICLEIEDPDGIVRLYVSATVDSVDSEDKLQCYTETHAVLMVFSCLSLLAYLPSLIFNLDFVEKLVRSQFIHKLDFVKVNVLLKISASAFTIFFGTSTNNIVLQSLSALFVFSIFIILAGYTWKSRPCLTFDKVNSYRVSMNLYGALFSVFFFVFLFITEEVSLIVLFFILTFLAILFNLFFLTKLKRTL